MNKTNYIIVGPYDSNNESFSYWHNDLGWIPLIHNATTFDVEIMTVHLPQNASGIVQLDHNNNIVGLWWALIHMENYPM